MQFLRQILRGVCVFLHILLGTLLSAVLNVLVLVGVRREPTVRWWHRALLRILNLRVEVIDRSSDRNSTSRGDQSSNGSGEGVPGHPLHRGETALFVCNHVSWLDIPVLGSQFHANFVSKAEVRDWPIIGWLAASAGTEFHKRGGGGARALIARIIQRLEIQQNIVIFPEGTTTMGTAVRRFQPRLFAAAMESDRAVVPIALKFGPGAEANADAATTCPYVGDDMFVPHLLRLLRLRKITATITVLPALRPADFPDRSKLAAAAEQAVKQVIAENPPKVDIDRPAFVFGEPASAANADR